MLETLSETLQEPPQNPPTSKYACRDYPDEDFWLLD